jgi:hypothetical protein
MFSQGGINCRSRRFRLLLGWAIILPIIFSLSDSSSLAYQGTLFPLDQVPWHRSSGLQLGLAGFCVVVFLSAAFVWPICPIIYRLRGKQIRMTARFTEAWSFAGLISMLNLAFLCTLFSSVRLSRLFEIGDILSSLLFAIQCIPLITAFLTLGLPFVVVFVWKNHCWSMSRKLHYCLGNESECIGPHPKSLSLGRGTSIRLPFSLGRRGWG